MSEKCETDKVRAMYISWPELTLKFPVHEPLDADYEQSYTDPADFQKDMEHYDPCIELLNLSYVGKHYRPYEYNYDAKRLKDDVEKYMRPEEHQQLVRMKTMLVNLMDSYTYSVKQNLEMISARKHIDQSQHPVNLGKRKLDSVSDDDQKASMAHFAEILAGFSDD